MQRLIILIVSGILLVSTTTGGVKAEEILKFTCDLYWTNNIFMVSKTVELKSEDLDVKTKDYIEWTEFSSTPNKPGYDWGVTIYNVNRNTGKGFYKMGYITEAEMKKFTTSNKIGSKFGFKMELQNNMTCFKTPDKKF